MVVSETDIIKEFFECQEVPLWGVADLSDAGFVYLPADAVKRFRVGIVYGFPLSDGVINILSESPGVTPNLLYLHHYRQVNYFLDRVGLLLSIFLQSKGYESLPVPASQMVDWEKQAGHLSHKRLAVSAGSGWIGRNNLLVTPGFGSRIRLATVLTAASLPAGVPMSFGCGDCYKCLTRCPAGAIKEKPDSFDHHACFGFIKKICRQNNLSQHICGLCLCPWVNQ
ncbi:MAG: hypothetical protein V2A65_05720 [Candidatus Omnitrophota bacterium]